MTNFDPGGLLMLLTVIPAVVAGVASVGLAHLGARLGVGEYETNVAVVLAVLLFAWIAASLVVSTDMLRILAVTLSMLGAYLVTRNVADASYGWVLGVLLLFVAFLSLDALGIYGGVDRSGRPQGLLARHLFAVYYLGLFLAGVIAGKAVDLSRDVLADVRR